MRRIASHYIYWKQFYRMHYVELDDSGILIGIFPLEGEIAGTEFYDGILIPVLVPALDVESQKQIAFDMLPGEILVDALERQGFTGISEMGSPVCLLLLNGIPLATAKFGADDSRSNGYIQRL
ncbi:hypothetical protein [uncultured Parabacteroides sp.]|uniref:hypothetical protein n=1 Tax=uncultured Parabacteroides sp. TaxID=512312 RepID=UPI0025F0E0D9|nr:hypothetical protein [uncultured Parabacteroides sp.]